MSYGSKQLRCYNEMVSRVIVQRKLKEKVTYSYIRRKELSYRQARARVYTDTRKREGVRDGGGDGKTGRRKE